MNRHATPGQNWTPIPGQICAPIDIQVGIWAGQDRYGRPILRGQTSLIQPGKSAGEMHMDSDIPFDVPAHKADRDGR